MGNALSLYRHIPIPDCPPRWYQSIPNLVIAGVLATLLSSCVSMKNPNIERGSSYYFREGYPEVRASAIGLFDQEGDPGINITTDVVYGSLIFKSRKDHYFSKIAVDLKLVRQGDKEKVIQTRHYSFTIKDSSESIVNSQEVFSIEKRIEAPPGKYKIYVVVTDKHSNKHTTRVLQASLPDPDQKKPHLTGIQMLGLSPTSSKSPYNPVTTYTVPGRIDSLRFRFQVSHQNPDTRLKIVTRLVRFKSDTTPARPMHYNNYSPASIQYKGIDYDERTTLRENTRLLTETGNILIEFRMPTPERGNYRFLVRIVNKEEKYFKARDFGVKSENYPAVKTVRELARPLFYLMEKETYKKMMSFSSTDSIKKYMDRFWLKHIKSKSKAKQVISKYYERVEEANKQFSNFKAGWKTDPGYIYILFGPPWYVEQSVDRMQWSYAYNHADPEYNYLFYQPRMQSRFFPFQHYLLQRHNYYYTVEYQQRQLWLNGTILKRSLQ